MAFAHPFFPSPSVDEATSALDATSRVLVHEAIKAWRDNRTTIIITHDLSPIAPSDFVYVMADGRVVQQGYREDLEAAGDGPFHDMVHMQGIEHQDEQIEALADQDGAPPGSSEGLGHYLAPDSVAARHLSAHRLSTSSLLFPPTVEDVVSAGRQLFSTGRFSHLSISSTIGNEAVSTPVGNAEGVAGVRRQRVSRSMSLSAPGDPDVLDRPRRYSDFSLVDVQKAGEKAVQLRSGGRRRLNHDEASMSSPDPGRIGRSGGTDGRTGDCKPRRSIAQLARRYWRTIPNKLLFAAGLGFSIMVGACTPIFSTFIARVISNLGNPDAKALITQSAIVVIALAVVDGSGSFLKFYCMERCAMGWTTALRRRALAKVIRQDKAFFDRPENTTSALSYSVIKDSEDARTLVGTIICQLAVLASMLIIGIAWSLVTGWELTLVGFGMAPVIIVVSRSLASVLNRLEAENKDKREAISKHLMEVSLGWHFNRGTQRLESDSFSSMRQVLSNVKAIRSMSIQPVFDGTYGRVVASTYAGGIRAAPFAGLGFASTFTLTYLSQGAGVSSRCQRPEEGNGIVADSLSPATGIMLLVGAVLVTSGRYTFGKMLQVFSLIIFTVTFAGQLMNYCKLFKACTALLEYDERQLTFFYNQYRRWQSHFKRRMTCCVYSIFTTKPTRHAGRQGLRYKDASASATSSSAILRVRPRRFCTASVSKSRLANAWPLSGAYPECLYMGSC